MPLDGVSITFLAEELERQLAGGRVDRVRQPGRYDIELQLRSLGANHRLLLSAHPSSTRAGLIRESAPVPQAAPQFCMLLRKQLLGARLEAIRAEGYERVLELRFSTRDELGDTQAPRLLLEVMGRHSNLILVNASGTILDAIRHVDASRSRLREVLPAHPYLPPPPQDKLEPAAALAALGAGRLLSEQQLAAQADVRLDAWLLERLQGWSRQLVREAVLRAGLEPSLRLGRMTAADRAALSHVLEDLLSDILAGRFSPSLYGRIARSDDPTRVAQLTDFHAMALQHQGHREATPTLSEAIERFYREREDEQRIEQRRGALERAVRQRLERLARREAIHRADVESSADYERERELAELLTANLWRLQGGEAELEVEDYYDPEQRPVTIELNPARSPSWNSQRRFQTYQRMRTRHARATAYLAEDRAELSYGSSLLAALAAAETESELAAIREEMRQNDWLAPAGGRGGVDGLDEATGHGATGFHARKRARMAGQGRGRSAARGGQQTALEPRRYVTGDGLTVLVGRNNLQNDRLTLRVARPDDLWFHARGAAGSHVILRTEGREVPDTSLVEAAEIAAWFSSAAAPLRASGQREGASITIDYCPRRNVRKPSGARPGMVIYEGHRSLVVTPRAPADPPASEQSQPDSDRGT